MGTLWEWHGHSGPVTVLLLTLVFGVGISLVALWIALPFAVFGIKSALRDLVAAQREMNRLLAGLSRPSGAPPATEGAPDRSAESPP